MTEVIESHIRGNFAGWKHRARFELANGQVWQQESNEYFDYHHHGVAVMIRADGPVGVIEVEGIPQTVKVRRVS